jgi:hypothetical protein
LGRGYQGRDSWRTHSDEQRYGGFERGPSGGAGGSFMSDYGGGQQDQWSGSVMPRHTGTAYGRGGVDYGEGREQQQRQWDPDYHQWRSEQLRRLDEDYEAFRKERYSKFSEEFNTWRSNRASQSPAAGPGATSGTSGTSGLGGTGSASPSSRVAASTSTSGSSSGSGGKSSENKQQG